MGYKGESHMDSGYYLWKHGRNLKEIEMWGRSILPNQILGKIFEVQKLEGGVRIDYPLDLMGYKSELPNSMFDNLMEAWEEFAKVRAI